MARVVVARAGEATVRKKVVFNDKEIEYSFAIEGKTRNSLPSSILILILILAFIESRDWDGKELRLGFYGLVG